MKKNSKILFQQKNEYTSIIKENLFDYSTNPAENIDLNYSTRSPLRYPGGKTRGIDFITQFFPKNLDKLLSPFLVAVQLSCLLLRKER